MYNLNCSYILVERRGSWIKEERENWQRMEGREEIEEEKK